eukprot:scaffold31550_cov60-Phaeocystis_antarctica.AAC.2
MRWSTTARARPSARLAPRSVTATGNSRAVATASDWSRAAACASRCRLIHRSILDSSLVTTPVLIKPLPSLEFFRARLAPVPRGSMGELTGGVGVSEAEGGGVSPWLPPPASAAPACT